MSDAQKLRADFVDGMSRAAFTVSLVTTDGPAGKAGLTVSAMTSVSADPPSILVCVNRESQFAGKLKENAYFGVSVLNANQGSLADAFAGRTEIEDRFTIGNWTTLFSMAPLLSDAVIAFDCALDSVAKVGTHDVAIGLVQRVAFKTPAQIPLIHHQRQYGRPETLIIADRSS